MITSNCILCACLFFADSSLRPTLAQAGASAKVAGQAVSAASSVLHRYQNSSVYPIPSNALLSWFNTENGHQSAKYELLNFSGGTVEEF
jgi:hypothetical protein